MFFSTISGALNCLSGTIFTIFFKKRFMEMGIVNERFTLKILVVIIGVVLILLAIVVEKLGDILSLAIGLASIAYGPLLGIFSLGLFFPTSNSKVTQQLLTFKVLNNFHLILGNILWRHDKFCCHVHYCHRKQFLQNE